MAVLKCKMCGGNLEVAENSTVCECEYCGSMQTLPKLDNDKKNNLYDRANHFRRNNEYDKAMGIYEQILNEDRTDAEAYWSLVLCRYGIEYVEDPMSHKRVPTVNRAQFTSIFDDNNYKSALQYADTYQKSIYEEEARVINEIQKGILAISQKEEPFDVFICYKESDNNGRRTPDSVLANDLYHQLIQEGFKVFFSRITLEDKLGSAYEPYIFAALNSAKVMVVLGTKPEYFNAVWVKNEWSRYLSMIKTGEKKMLIPAYKDMDPYDLPEEFSHLQAQDMSKLGFMQDLIRGIKKIVGVEEVRTVQISEAVVTSVNANIEPLLKRAFMFLEDGEWENADEYCEKVLDIEPENALAYVGKLMVELKVKKRENFVDCSEVFDNKKNYQKVIRFADEKLRKELEGYVEYIRNRNETARLDGIYVKAMIRYETADTEEMCKQAAGIFGSIIKYKDAVEMRSKCLEKAEKCKWEKIEGIYVTAVGILNSATEEQNYQNAEKMFASIADYKDSSELIKQCREKAEIIRKDNIYSKAKVGMEQNTIISLEEAIQNLERIPDWKDANELIGICKQNFINLQKEEIYIKAKETKKKDTISDLETAIQQFESISEWKDSQALILGCKNRIEEIKKTEEKARKDAEAKAKRNKRNIIIVAIVVCVVCVVALVMNTVIIPNNKYNKAVASLKSDNYVDAYEGFKKLEDFKDSKVQAESITKQYYKEKLKDAKVGEYIQFGSYEQDNNLSNGKEDIQWIVLERKENTILVISKYVLDCKQYHSEYDETNWENSTLRKWLNQKYINAAFSDNEKTMIQAVNVTMDNFQGNETQDQIFLLSVKEVKDYFKSNKERQCEATPYALANATITNSKLVDDKNGKCYWWLRTKTETNLYAARVKAGGDIYEEGYYVPDVSNGIRPAMWIDLDN